jgi:hypothetical protein
MLDKHTEAKARKLLPDPLSYPKHYIDIVIPVKNRMHEVVAFVKADKDGSVYWMALQYAR